jgi:FAD synthetase
MVFGAFDGLHPGHLDFFKQARRLGDYLIVSVARDINVERIKGKKPLFGEEERLELISNLKIVDEAVLGARHDFYIQIKQNKPDIVCLGYDQWATEDEVLENIRGVGLLDTEVVRLNSYKPERAKSTILKEKSVDF